MSKVTLDSGNNAWTYVCTSYVFLMAPAVGLAISSGVKPKNRTSVLFLTLMMITVAYIEWYMFGYSLALSPTATSTFIGNFDNAFLLKIIPDYQENAFYLLNFFGQLSGLGLSISILLSGVTERSSIKSVFVFVVLWIPLIYSVILYWFAGVNGWAKELGFISYSCGLPNIIIGCSVLVYTKMLGKREKSNQYKDRDLQSQRSFGYLGVFLIWFTWIGVNSGGTGGANTRALICLINTNLSAAMGALSLPLLSKLLFKTNLYEPCFYMTGLIAGLLSVSPAAGFIDIHYSLVFGFMGAVAALMAIKLKDYFEVDETGGVVETHLAASVMGTILVAIFADTGVSTISEGVPIAGGWVNGHFAQLYMQLAPILAAISYSCLISFVICFILKSTPFFEFRVCVEDENKGLDLAQLEVGPDYEDQISHNGIYEHGVSSKPL